MISVVSGSGGGAFLPADDQPIPTPLTPITPIISVAIRSNELQDVGNLVRDAVKAGDVDAARMITESPALVEIANNIGRDVVVSAINGGATAGMPDPNCDGSSLETIPTPITPYVHEARLTIRAEHLPQFRRQLTAMLEAIDQAERALAPSAKEARVLTKQLEGALQDLRQGRSTS